MEEILKKRCADLTVLEILKLAHLKNKVERPFIDMAIFCEISGLDRNWIYNRFRSNNSGIRELVWGGYEKYIKYNRKKKLYFDTGKVLEWLSSRE